VIIFRRRNHATIAQVSEERKAALGDIQEIARESRLVILAGTIALCAALAAAGILRHAIENSCEMINYDSLNRQNCQISCSSFMFIRMTLPYERESVLVHGFEQRLGDTCKSAAAPEILFHPACHF